MTSFFFLLIDDVRVNIKVYVVTWQPISRINFQVYEWKMLIGVMCRVVQVYVRFHVFREKKTEDTPCMHI